MAGICVLIFGSTFSANYYFYYCRPNLLKIYVTLSFVSNMTGFVITMCDFIHKLEYAHYKGVIFAIIGVLNGFSMMHSVYFGIK